MHYLNAVNQAKPHAGGGPRKSYAVQSRRETALLKQDACVHANVLNSLYGTLTSAAQRRAGLV